MTEIPDAEIVVIGGGAIGCGVAYALAKAGKTDILLLERAEERTLSVSLCLPMDRISERVHLARAASESP